jgi:hypothetical protein
LKGEGDEKKEGEASLKKFPPSPEERRVRGIGENLFTQS